MKKHMLRVLSMAIALTMSMTFALSGCGSDTGSSTSGEGTTSSTEESTGTEEGASTEETGDTETAQTTDYSDVVINYGLTTAWDSLNPYGSSSGSTFQHLVLDKLYDRLAYITEAAESIEPRAAESWESSEDGMTATFHLDPDAKFHDGTPVTANDWVFTAYLITDPNFDFGMKSEFKFFEGTDDSGVRTGDTLGIEAVDDTTLVMHFKTPTPVEDWIMLHNKYFYVLPEHLLGDMDPAEVNASDIWDNPNDLGSGPCTYISELSGSQLELGSFADYQLGAPKFGKLVYTVISASNTVTSVMTGELDMFIQSASIEDSLAAEEMGVPVQKSDLPTSIVAFLINNQNVSDKRIRQAMNLAIDKEMLIEQNVEGQGVPSATFIIPGSEYDAGIEWSRDVEQAKALLEEAGWDSSQTLTMAVTSTRERMAAVIQQNLAEVGINIEILTVDLATEFAGLQDGTYDLGICGSTATNYPLWMEGYYDYRNATYCQITDPTFAEYQEQIASEMDETARKELVNEYQQFLYDEMPLVMLYHAYSFSVISPRMSGVHQSDSGMLNEAVWNWEVTE